MKLTFFAKVLPERFALTATEIPYEAVFPVINYCYKAHLSIHSAQVIMQITTESTQVDLDTVRNLVEGDIRHFLDFYGFVHGVRFDLDIISVVDDAGNWRVFGIDIPS